MPALLPKNHQRRGYSTYYGNSYKNPCNYIVMIYRHQNYVHNQDKKNNISPQQQYGSITETLSFHTCRFDNFFFHPANIQIFP